MYVRRSCLEVGLLISSCSCFSLQELSVGGSEIIVAKRGTQALNRAFSGFRNCGYGRGYGGEWRGLVLELQPEIKSKHLEIRSKPVLPHVHVRD
jgi:hypothetical protein